MKLKRIIKIGVGIILLGVLTYFSINYYILKSSESNIYYTTDKLPTTQAAVILGAKVMDDGKLSDILYDRTLKGLELYEEDKVSKILISGDHGTVEYDEVNAVKDYLLNKGVLAEDIFLDHAGFDTYDSIYRAKEIFKIESLTIVTQEFHLPRAVYIGNSLGMETYGFVADRQIYVSAKWNAIRESIARIKAFGNVLLNSKPTYLGDPIPITGDGHLSWD